MPNLGIHHARPNFVQGPSPRHVLKISIDSSGQRATQRPPALPSPAAPPAGAAPVHSCISTQVFHASFDRQHRRNMSLVGPKFTLSRRSSRQSYPRARKYIRHTFQLVSSHHTETGPLEWTKLTFYKYVSITKSLKRKTANL